MAKHGNGGNGRNDRVNMNAAVLIIDTGVEEVVKFQDDYDTQTHVFGKAREIRVNGKAFSHVGEDEHGRWTYQRA